MDSARKKTKPAATRLARGGSIDGAGGPIVIAGTLFLTSGYSFGEAMPGNVPLAFSVDGKMIAPA